MATLLPRSRKSKARSTNCPEAKRAARDFRKASGFLNQSFENVGEAFEGAFETGLGELLVGGGGVGVEDSPGRGVEPAFVFDGSAVAAGADAGVAGEHVGDVDGGGEFARGLAVFGMMMVARHLDEDGRELVLG